MQTNKTSSIKNAGAQGTKRCTVRGNARKLSRGKTTKGFKNYATEQEIYSVGNREPLKVLSMEEIMNVLQKDNSGIACTLVKKGWK